MTSPKNLFEWLTEITVSKTSPKHFSEESWDKFNSYMVHRYLSMDINYIDIVNYVQKINPTNKKQIYSIYREMIPKRKVWLKYLKNEADHYIDILGISVRTILWEMGVEEKETNELIKKAKL